MSVNTSTFTTALKTLPVILIVVLAIASMPVVAMTKGPASVETRLEQVRIDKLGRYPVRTQYLKPDGSPQYTNRLVMESSPYLLQHAHNPVNWYAWTDEAFAAARRENKPIFLSIGYATCHWCHVMENESFDNEAVARILNQHFISIKVDREQRPDLDDIYMSGAMIISGQGGWPLSGFLTLDAKPFFVASYFPRDAFVDLLTQVRQKWINDRTALEELAAEVYQVIVREGQYAQSADSVTSLSTDLVIKRMLDYEDKTFGGIDEVPKFPMEPKLLLMLNQLMRQDNIGKSPLWRFMVRMLNGMLQGGIYDQIGGGFHRYATDKAWLIPHFEKTLYNQAQLAQIYTQAWLLSGDSEYRRISTETLDYVLRDMRGSDGCFYSAFDADSEGEEGKFYSWQSSQIDRLFNKDETDFINSLYGVSQSGNFNGHNVLHLPQSLKQIATLKKLSYQELVNKIIPLRRRMYHSRTTRVAPLQDNKQVTQWNAMMIMALANNGLLSGQSQYIDAAIKCADVIWQQGRDSHGHLYRSIIAGQPAMAATLADYGYYLQALLTLYDVSDDRQWLERAGALHQTMTELFEDPQQGGFYNSVANSRGPLLIRNKASVDNDMASGNSAALMAMVMLRHRSDINSLKKQIDRTISFFAAALNQRPLALSSMLMAISQYRNPVPASVAYAARGKVRIETVYHSANKELSIYINIVDGWHINSHQPLQQNLIATDVESKTPSLKFSYPAGKIKALGFSQQKLSLYENSVELTGELANSPLPRYAVYNLRLQACSDKLCLPPESVLITPIVK